MRSIKDKLLPNYKGLPYVLPDFGPKDATSSHAMVLSAIASSPTRRISCFQ